MASSSPSSMLLMDDAYVQGTIHEFEKRQTDAYAKAQDRFRQKPVLELLSNPSSLCRARLVLPMPWICGYSVLRLVKDRQSEDPTLSPFNFFLAFIVAYFIADLVTGLVHMRLDTIKIHIQKDKGLWRDLVEQAAWGFQRHHAVQHNWLHDDILDSGILTTGLLTVPFFWIYLGLCATGSIGSPCVAFGWTVFITAGMHVQLIHAAAHNTWKHREWLSVCLEVLRSAHLILGMKEHHLHHTRFDCNFAMINGWSNVLLNPLYSWLEANGCIDPDLTAETQRAVYIQQKAQLTEPYLRIFPEYRAHQNACNTAS